MNQLFNTYMDDQQTKKTDFIKKIIFDHKVDLFHDLKKSTEFEDILPGRVGAVLVDQYDLTPIVRTTTKYKNPAQQFKPIHYEIINNIKKAVISSIPDLDFNNALIEIYDNNYCTMGYHTDQALDLKDGSYIGIYSCYEKPSEIDELNSRKLIIKNKVTDDIIEISMDHNSVILFDLATNQQHLHKIVASNNKLNKWCLGYTWLGITFRLSKTFIHHIDNIPYFYKTDKILTLATTEESKTFYKLKSEENKKIDFDYSYSDITYTISPSDLLQPL